MMKRETRIWNGWLGALAALTVAFTAVVPSTRAADAADKERELLAVLKSDAPKGEKGVACKLLTVWGSETAVPELAPLLLDPELASWARIPLEAIPGDAASAALRDALPKLEGRLLVGTINSIGVRQDRAAVPALVELLKSTDVDVASAAGLALGHTGGRGAMRALQAALGDRRMEVRSAVARGAMLLAERMLAAGNGARAVRVYDTVRDTDVPEQRLLEATRGAILARGAEGLPLLLEQLRSADKAFLGIGLRTARELPGVEITKALADEVGTAAADRAPYLLLAVADRQDAAVLPAVTAAAEKGSPPVRLVAVQALENIGNATSIPVLLGAAAAPDKALSAAAVETLVRLAGTDIDPTLTGRLPASRGGERAALIEVCALRQIHAAVPEINLSATDKDAVVRDSALTALGLLGGENEVKLLVNQVEQTTDAGLRSEYEEALLSVASRAGAGCVSHLMPLTRRSEPALRITAIHALASVGGGEAVAAVVAALKDANGEVQDEAVRALSTWAGNWPDDVAVAEPLLALARSGTKRSHQVLGFRGYLQYVQADSQLSDPKRAEMVLALMAEFKQPEERQSAISVLGAIPAAASLDALRELSRSSDDAETALSALVSLAGRDIPNVSRETRRAALQEAISESKNEATVKRAQDLLRRLR
ncbi:MAG: HEAT repeat domain-containing protein [Verrucomicrobiales bacterium]|nr:HEAT repeat domain-containing protein [Verrucomicrobiales bacterium]